MPDTYLWRCAFSVARIPIGDNSNQSKHMREVRYQTPHGIANPPNNIKTAVQERVRAVLRELDKTRGIYLSSGYEYPGRYSRWDIVSVRPPLELVTFQREVTFRALNERGVAINKMLATVLREHPHWEDFREENGALHGTLKPMPKLFPEEQRSKQPSVFSILQATDHGVPQPEPRRQAGVRRGVQGYDLLFRFEPYFRCGLPLARARRILVYLFCQYIIYADRKREAIERFSYEFEQGEISTRGLERAGERVPKAPKRKATPITTDHTKEEYMANAGSGPRRHGAGRLLRSSARADVQDGLFGQGFGVVSADAAGEPESL